MLRMLSLLWKAFKMLMLAGVVIPVVFCLWSFWKESKESTGEPKSSPSLAFVDLSAGLAEKAPEGPWGLFSRGGGFDQLVSSLHALEGASFAKGLFVRFGSSSISFAQAVELSRLLESLRRNKLPIFCHAEHLSNTTMYVAARGCNQIAVSPLGEVATVGIAAQIIYMRKLLEEKLHLSLEVLQVGKYKGAEEPFMRDGPSDEARSSLSAMLKDLRNIWMEGVAKGRSDLEPGSLEQGPYTPGEAIGRGLVDRIAYAEEALEEAKKKVDVTRVQVLFGESEGPTKPLRLSNILSLFGSQQPTLGEVVLVHALGPISMEDEGTLSIEEGGISAKEFSHTVEKLTNEDAVKAVVLRIDSPGGSALASDLIWSKLMQLRAKKPLVVSVGAYAASGGYYLASAGTEIFAEPVSVLGSIGVVGGKVSVGDALERLGVHVETFAASPHAEAAARATYASPWTRWDPPTRTRMRDTMANVYDLFVDRIAKGRKLPRTQIEPSAEGRLFSGREAKTRGLIDTLGGLTEAIAKAKTLAHLPATATVVTYTPPADFLSFARGRSSLQGRGFREETLRLLGGRVPPVAASLVEFWSLLRGEQALAITPFALNVQ